MRPLSCSVVYTPDLRTRMFTYRSCSCTAALQGVELGARDRYKTHRIAGAEEAGWLGFGGEHFHRRAADEVPASRRFQRVHAGLVTANGYAARGNMRARRIPARRGDAGIQVAEKGEARYEPKQVHAVIRAGVNRGDFFGREPMLTGHLFQVF